jgi:uncharacterized protein YndB with AHSA1/START domain
MTHIDARAPVVGAAEVEIAAAPDLVWEILTDLERWPSWNPDVKSMSKDSAIAAGTEFRWKAGPGTITSTIQQVVPPRQFSWTGRTLGIRAVHVWRLEPRDGATTVRTEESYEGLVARVLRRPLQKTLDTALENGLRYLKAEAERRAATA